MIENENDFRRFIGCRNQELVRLCRYIINQEKFSRPIDRTPLGLLLQESRRVEEILDTYGAKYNSKWALFRNIAAALKFSSDTLYKLLHLIRTYPIYDLLPIESDFQTATEHAVSELTTMTVSVARAFIDTSLEMKMDLPTDIFREFCAEEKTRSFQLPKDRETRNSADPGKIVTSLSTAFLNQAEGTDIIQINTAVKNKTTGECIPKIIGEKEFRRFENNFHNLQALYDTYISGTNVETHDPDLSYLRGHISVIFHILEISTALCHYYERHMRTAEADRCTICFLTEEQITHLLIDYSLHYTVEYLKKAKELCRGMLKKYAVITELDVPVPVYRGFHVRPSALISKIVIHYGSSVTMSLDGQECNAASPLEIMRFNEKINAMKRKKLGEDIVKLSMSDKSSELETHKNYEGVLSVIFLSLLEEKKIIIYSGDLELEEFSSFEGESLAEYATRGLARLLALGKIDIHTDTKVTFRGDTRVLEDIKVLADTGYGEDNFGNNIALPTELSWLRR